jgi:arylformamidase
MRIIKRLLRCSVALALVAGTAATALLPAHAAGGRDDTPAASGRSGAGTEYSYGPGQLQKLDFWHAKHRTPAPLVVFVHGGGWKGGDKQGATGLNEVAHLTEKGYAYASINYRLVPTATVEQQAADVASAVAWLLANAVRLDVDASRIVLMGHSAGAHLVTLVGTDPHYFHDAGMSLADVRGVIALDGACYDVPRQIKDGSRFMTANYVAAFGRDPVRQRMLSPSLNAAAPNAPAFLLIHINRPDGKAQSEELAEALAHAGTAVELFGTKETGLLGHLELNKSLGRDDFPATAVVDRWLGAVAPE